jgi:hypothetical protein
MLQPVAGHYVAPQAFQVGGKYKFEDNNPDQHRHKQETVFE